MIAARTAVIAAVLATATLPMLVGALRYASERQASIVGMKAVGYAEIAPSAPDEEPSAEPQASTASMTVKQRLDAAMSALERMDRGAPNQQ